jgi:Fe-Mn family superoxide dismutase
LNELVQGTPWDGKPLEQIAVQSEAYTPLNNNAAQAWAHDFWWRSMHPKKLPVPSWLDKKNFENAWITKGTALFGSGWLWFVMDTSGKFDIQALPDAVLPQRQGFRPILVMDLWEHSYYCQYGTKRVDYLRKTLPLLNWAEAERRIQHAMAR